MNFAVRSELLTWSYHFKQMGKDMRDVTGLVTYIEQIREERCGARVAVGGLVHYA